MADLKGGGAACRKRDLKEPGRWRRFWPWGGRAPVSTRILCASLRLGRGAAARPGTLAPHS
eukprot:394010-Pyramimonas_sp.AAC.1